MGRKLDALLGRNFKTSKLKTLAKLAISRIAILKKQRQVRCSHARSDVRQLLNLGHQKRALSRVEQVIKEQNMLDAFVMIENYCHILIERVVLLKKNKECSDEHKEVISSLIFASSRCGEFPELQHIREIFVSKFGKDFNDDSVNLRKDCGVNPKMIQKLSAEQPSLESRLNILKEIASENGVTLNLEEYVPVVTEENLNVNQKQKQPECNYYSTSLDNSVVRDDTCDLPEKLNLDELSESIKEMKYYRDAEAAARDACVSATYAAAAARAAVELSRSESRDNDPDDYGGFSPQQGTIYDSGESSTSKLQRDEYAASEDIKHSDDILGFVKVHPIDFISESEGEDIAEDGGKVHLKGMEDSKSNAELERTLSVSSSDSGDILIERKLSSDLLNQGDMLYPKHYELSSDRKPRLPTNEYHHLRYDAVDEENLSDEDGNKSLYRSPKWVPLKSQADPMIRPVEGEPRLSSKHSLNTVEQSHSQHSNTNRKEASMRTRRAPGA